MHMCCHTPAEDVVLGQSLEELTALAAADGQPGYRGKQLLDGVMNGARSIDDISNVRARVMCIVENAYTGGCCLAKVGSSCVL